MTFITQWGDEGLDFCPKSTHLRPLGVFIKSFLHEVQQTISLCR